MPSFKLLLDRGDLRFERGDLAAKRSPPEADASRLLDFERLWRNAPP
jgi:hypothetical protein